MRDVVEVDLLVIGQGLAGSALAMQALSRGYRIMVLDQPLANRSSRVAAGLFNPITGRKMSKTWLADELFPFLHQYYRDVECRTGKRFFFAMPIYRAFVSVQEQNEWMAKSDDHVYRQYISDIATRPAFGTFVNDEYGGISLKQCGYLNTGAYLDAVRDYLAARGCYVQADFQPEKLEIGNDFVRYAAPRLRARRVVFCQGVGNSANPWFGYVPIKPLKGEFLTVQCDWEKRVILNRGVYVVPGASPGEWRVGATFARDDIDPGVTARARDQLCRKLEELIRTPFTITGQQWGFRPTTPDRRPILGAHPQHKSMVIFNGLGTKGVSLAPYFSDVLIRWMEGQGTINEEADVSRF